MGSYPRRCGWCGSRIMTCPEVRGLFNALFTRNGLGLSKFAETGSKVAGTTEEFPYLYNPTAEQAIRARYQPNAASDYPMQKRNLLRTGTTKIFARRIQQSRCLAQRHHIFT